MKSPLDIVRSFLRATQPLAHGEIGRPRVRVKETLAYLLVFTLLVVTVAGFLYWHIASSYQQEIISWRVRQSSMASDRAERVSDWLRERQRDAQLVAARPLVRSTLLAHDEARELPENPTASLPGSLPILEQVSNWYSYAGVYVLDPDGQVIRQSKRSIPFNPLFADICRATARSGDMRIDLAGDAPSRSMIGFTAPVFTGAVSTDEILPDAKHLGTVLIVAVASQTLFPLVTREVIPTRTGETVLVRREGNDIVFFSPLRFVQAGSPNLRFPLSTAPIAARLALEGRETFAEYKDYRGAPVLAATQEIPLTGWGLVRKIDRVEALEDFRRQAIAEGVAACFLTTLLAGLLLFHRRHVLTRVLKQKEEKFVALLESAPDAIYVIEPSSLRIRGRNRKAMEMDGYSDEEIFRMTVTDLHPPEDHPLLREWFQRQTEVGGVLHLHSLRGKGGQLVPVEERQTLVDAGGERLVLSIVRDITERKRAEAALRESEEHFRSLFENMLNGFAFCRMHYEQNLPQDFTYLDVNHAFETLTGLKNVVGRRVSDVIPGIREADPELFEVYGRVALTGTPERIETYVAALRMWFAIAVYSPKKEYFVAVFDVITERKRAEQELLRVNRALRTISDCNQVLVRAAEERQLLEEVCGILVLEGGYRLAWVGYGEHDEAKSIRPVAHAGLEEGYLQSVCITWTDSERGRGPTGSAIRTGKPVIARDIRTDPNVIPWREEALKRGYASSIALPINLDDGVLGALTLYAGEVDAFDLAEVELLTELADDLAYGVQALRTRAERQRVEEAHDYLASIVQSSDDAIIGKSLDGVIQSWNKGAERLYGYPASKMIGKPFSILVPPERKGEVADFLLRIKRDEVIEHYETVRVKKGGGLIDVSVTISPLKDAGGKVTGASTVARDITAHKRAEEALIEERHLLHTVMDNLPDKIYFKDRNSHFTRINLALASELKLGHPDQAVGKADFDFFPSEQAREFSSDEQEIIRTGHPVVNKEERVEWPDGHAAWSSTTKMPLRDAKGNIIGTFGVSRDITERKRAEAELADRLQFETLLAELSAIFVHVPAEQIDGEIKDAQRRVCESLALDACSLWQVMPETPGFIPLTHIYRPAEGAPIPEGINAGHYLPWSTQQILAGKVIVASSLEELPTEAARDRQTFGFFGIKSVLAMGLAVGGGPVIGGLAFSTRTARTWPEEIVKRLQLVAELFCSAIERHRSEAVLRESEERFRSLVENATVGIYRTTPQGRILMANPTLVKMLGFEDFAELADRNLEEQGFEPDYPRSLFCERMERDGEVRGLEEAWKRRDGSVIFVRESARTIRGEDGKTLYYNGIVEDITERKRAEEELYQSRQMLKSILDTIPQRVFWKDKNIVYLGCNKAFAMEAGLKDPAEIVGKNDYELAWRETAEAYRADDKLVMEQDTPRLGYEETQNRPDGSVIWLRTSKLPLHDQEGKVMGILGTYEDFTERKQAEAEHLRLVTAVEQSAEAVVITNTNGDIKYVNPAFTRTTGYGREEALGQNTRILKSGKQDPEFYRQLWSTILNGQTWHGELINRRKDGKLYTEETTITPIVSASGEVTHFIATKQDVTERRILEAQLHQAAKMEAIGRLAGGVAHDFNNLLTIINGYSQILMEKLKSDTQSSEYLKEILDAGERAATLTRQLLAFSRRQVLAPQVLDLNAVVSNLDKMLRRLIGEDIKLHTHLDPTLGRVKADPGQIEQVLMNLVVNARDAMPTGGNLTLETSNVELDETYASTHPTVKPGPHVMLAVGDTGAGMTAETKAQIFEPFFTTKEQGKGTGLGLATVYGIVKQSEGSIWVYSELGQGTVFKIYLPMVSESLAPSEPATREKKSSFSGTETILVVEDEEGVRSLVCQALEASGYKVLESEDAENALEMCANHDGPIHLLLTDVVMPQMSGPAVAEKVAALRPGIKVVYMSGYTDDAMLRHGVLSQDMPFIQKPFSPTALRKKIREVLGEKQE